MKRKLPKVGVIAARGLGDGLLNLILSHNLQKAGFEVITFNTPLTALQEWFPNQTIRPFSDFFLLSAVDQIIVTNTKIPDETYGKKITNITEKTFDKGKTFAENLQLFCIKNLDIPVATKENGMVAKSAFYKNRYPKRVVIHPTSSSARKNWSKDKFLSLASHLIELGYQPALAMSPSERPLWEDVEMKGLEFPHFATLDETAAYIYESGFLIGNDSGLGHLASNLGIPVVSLFERKSQSHLWRPDWTKGSVVHPPFFLMGNYFKRNYWKECLSVKRVLNAFKRLAQ